MQIAQSSARPRGGGARVAVVVEDDADVRNLVISILEEAGFEAVPAPDGQSGIDAVRTHDPILTTLDVSLPGIDGFEVVRRIRGFSDTYVIMLSARAEEIDTLMGLDAGADDYLTKPFRPRELRARIEAMLRRYPKQPIDSAQLLPGDRVPIDVDQQASGLNHGAPPVAASSVRPEATDVPGDAEPGWLVHNGLRMHSAMWRCELDGEPTELTRTEFDLMHAILAANRRVLSKDALALELRGTDTSGYVSSADRRSVEVHIANLRRKLGDPVSRPRFVQTVRGVGYRLADPIQ